MIRSGSTTIIPKEVEDVIVQHPAVAEVAVIGLPDVEWGEAVTAFVVTKPGMSVAEVRSGGALPRQAGWLQEAALDPVRGEPAALALRQGAAGAIDRADDDVRDRCPAQRF